MKYKKEISAGGIVYLSDRRQVKSKIQNPKSKKDNVLWLITKHSKFGHWSFPKGLVGDEDENEKREDAALREVEEEGGVKAEIIKDQPIVVKYKYKLPSPKLPAGSNVAGKEDTLIDKTVHYYLMRYLSGDPNDHDWEVSEAKFATADGVRKLLTFKNDVSAFQQAVRLYDKLSA